MKEGNGGKKRKRFIDYKIKCNFIRNKIYYKLKYNKIKNTSILIKFYKVLFQ
jgi:hypothetical protein